MPEEATATTTEAAPAEVTPVADDPAPAPESAVIPEPAATQEISEFWAHNKDLNLKSDMVGWLETKNHTDLQAALDSGRELERKMGGPPEMFQKWFESDDEEGKQAVYARLGKPENVEGYKIEFEEGAPIDADTLTWFKTQAFEHNMTNEQVQGIALAFNTETARIQTEQQDAIDVRNQTEEVELRNSLGTKYDESIDFGGRALAAHGLTDENVEAIQSIIGPKALVEFGIKVANTMGEDNIAAATGTAPTLTSEAAIQSAKDELTGELLADPERRKKFMSDSKTDTPKEATGKDFRKMQLLDKQLQSAIAARLNLTLPRNS